MTARKAAPTIVVAPEPLVFSTAQLAARVGYTAKTVTDNLVFYDDRSKATAQDVPTELGGGRTGRSAVSGSTPKTRSLRPGSGRTIPPPEASDDRPLPSRVRRRVVFRRRRSGLPATAAGGRGR
jgi:hypothetical protein